MISAVRVCRQQVGEDESAWGRRADAGHEERARVEIRRHHRGQLRGSSWSPPSNSRRRATRSTAPPAAPRRPRAWRTPPPPRARTFTGIVCDVSDAESCEKGFTRDRRAHGRWPIYAVVNNAGTAQAGAIEDVSDDLARQQLEINLIAPARVARLVLPGMRERGTGHIINISSIAGRMSIPIMGWYCASKPGLEAMTRRACRGRGGRVRRQGDPHQARQLRHQHLGGRRQQVHPTDQRPRVRPGLQAQHAGDRVGQPHARPDLGGAHHPPGPGQPTSVGAIPHRCRRRRRGARGEAGPHRRRRTPSGT